MSKISQLSSVRNVILLSTRGELFFSSKPVTDNITRREITGWKDITEELDRPDSAELIFENTRYYLKNSDLGYIIIGLRDNTSLDKIKLACNNTFHKLADPVLRKKILLKMLGSSDDQIKLHIIKELVPLADSEVAASLISLLSKETDFDREVREKLQLFICQTLGHCSSYEAVEPLKSFLAGHEQNSRALLNAEIRDAVRIAVQQLEQSAPRRPAPPPFPAASESTGPAVQRVRAPAAKPPKGADPVQVDIPRADQIGRLLDSGHKDEAVSLIMSLIEETAKKQQFAVADALRNRLIQIDSMMLMEIVRAAEIIEEEKQASINQDHLTVWKDLAEALTPEEFSALYHAMKLKNYPNNEFIARQGANLATLFFINSGRVQIQATRQGLAIPLIVKEAGGIIGAGTFFEASVWTVNVKSLGAELFLLSRKNLDALKAEHPSLESKLAHFCSTFQSTSTIIKKIRKNRREFERKKTSGRLSFAVLDRSGNETGIVAKGDLLDLSKGGVAFSIHSSRRKNAVKLFGRNLRVSMNAGISSGLLNRNGIVRAVRDMDLIGNEYSVHIKFSKALSSMELQQILSTAAE